VSDPIAGPAAGGGSGLSAGQRRVLLAAADVLVPADGGVPAASATAGFDEYLDRALAARTEVLPDLGALLDALPVGVETVGTDPGADGMALELRRMDSERPDDLRLLTDVVAGAYFMIPAVLARIGYPGQHREPARLEDAADEIETGILDPVIDRGWQVRYPPDDQPPVSPT
jgi:hypothetical protein